MTWVAKEGVGDVIPSAWEDVEETSHGDNYGSAIIAHMGKVQKIIFEEEKKGWLRRMRMEEAVKKYGPEVQVASLGAVPKDPSWEEVRVVRDKSQY